jgi:branched-chain amino acid transport system ATP-binding protein
LSERFYASVIRDDAAHLRARKGLARVFQNFGIFRDCTLRENMLIALESSTPLWRSVFPWGSTLKKNIDASEIFLKQIGLEAQADKKASSLSGGQMRLLEIARALAFGAELLLLDEPTAGVSPKMKGQVAELLKKVQASGKSIVVIEHDINFIQSFCSRILVLDGGKVVLDDTPEIVKASPLLAEIYFGSGPIHQ